MVSASWKSLLRQLLRVVYSKPCVLGSPFFVNKRWDSYASTLVDWRTCHFQVAPSEIVRRSCQDAFHIMGLLYFVGLVSSRIANSNEDNRQPSISIVGGTPARVGEFPALGAIRTGKGQLQCGGTLIAPSHVLTAAHCVEGFSTADVSKFTMIFNSTTWTNGGTGAVTVTVKRPIIHEKWDSAKTRNDIAILLLNSPITTIPLTKLPTDSTATTTKKPTTRRPTTRPTTKQATTKLPTTKRPTTKAPCSCTCPPNTVMKQKANAEAFDSRAFSSYANAAAVVAGWGKTTEGGNISPVLLKANVTVQDNSVCASQYETSFVATIMMCASAPGRDTCQNDSGGPMYVNGIQVGITSFGRGCADPDYAGIYTRVTNYVDWIAKTVANNPA